LAKEKNLRLSYIEQVADCRKGIERKAKREKGKQKGARKFYLWKTSASSNVEKDTNSSNRDGGRGIVVGGKKRGKT